MVFSSDRQRVSKNCKGMVRLTRCKLEYGYLLGPDSSMSECKRCIFIDNLPTHDEGGLEAMFCRSTFKL